MEIFELTIGQLRLLIESCPDRDLAQDILDYIEKLEREGDYDDGDLLVLQPNEGSRYGLRL